MSKKRTSEKKGPNLLCRVINATPQNVVSLVKILPKEKLPLDAFKDIILKADGKWFQNTHQAAEQWGLYYVDENFYYPRFYNDITIQEAEEYLKIWIMNYPVVNPYTKFKVVDDRSLVRCIVEHLENHPHEHDFKTIVRNILNIDEPFVVNEIITNAINKFSGVLRIENVKASEELFNVYLTDNYKSLLSPQRNMDKKEFFNLFNSNNQLESNLSEYPLQQIFFGAPGTGKSHAINEVCAVYENYRTTFHPDTDYASFVGSYKPITIKGNLHAKIGSNEVVLKDEEGNNLTDTKIVYRYVFQSFLKAYVAAWKEQQNKEPKPVFLVIEEINRGNCAQIFGDIFQLLDRNEAGYSDYPIVADDDLAQELGVVLAQLSIAHRDSINALYKGGKDVVGQVLSGSHLLLPNNLYIWATMNTSDQSLFPIDSAFKRRWDWKYIKIKNAEKDYRIVFSNGHQYDWYKFVSAINRHIEGGEIQQEDKKLGYFFAKGKRQDDGSYHISAESFLSKVIFYLYQDVFKDFGFEDEIFKGKDNEIMTFPSYFHDDGSANEDCVEKFILNVINKYYPDEVDGGLTEDDEAAD